MRQPCLLKKERKKKSNVATVSKKKKKTMWQLHICQLSHYLLLKNLGTEIGVAEWRCRPKSLKFYNFLTKIYMCSNR